MNQLYFKFKNQNKYLFYELKKRKKKKKKRKKKAKNNKKRQGGERNTIDIHTYI